MYSDTPIYLRRLSVTSKSFCGDKYNLGVSQLWYNYFHKSEYHALHDHVGNGSHI